MSTENIQQNIKDLQNTLSYQAIFSIGDLIPLLEKQLTSTFRKPYQVEAFFIGLEGSSNINTYFLAFPKKDSYINAYFYNSKNENELFIARTVKPKRTVSKIGKVAIAFKNKTLNLYNKQLSNMQEDPETFLIAKDVIKSEEAIRFLTHNQYPEKRYLYEGRFCYPQELDFLGDTIEEFAMKNVKEAKAKEENQLQKKIPTI